MAPAWLCLLLLQLSPRRPPCMGATPRLLFRRLCAVGTCPKETAAARVQCRGPGNGRPLSLRSRRIPSSSRKVGRALLPALWLPGR